MDSEKQPQKEPPKHVCPKGLWWTKFVLRCLSAIFCIALIGILATIGSSGIIGSIPLIIMMPPVSNA
jgi:hypothetical protein